MILHSKTHDVRYIDPSISDPGDGTTPAKAYKDFPTSASEYPENVVFIVRRSSSDTVYAKLPTNLSVDTQSLVIWGMPKSTNTLYQSIPQEAKTAWGSDNGDYAYILYDFNNTDVPGLCADGCKNFDMQYVALMVDGNTSSGHRAIRVRNGLYGCNAVIKYCWFRASTNWVLDGTRPSDDRHGGRYLSVNEGDNYSYNRFGHRVVFTNNQIDVYSRIDVSCFNFCYTEYVELKDVNINICQANPTVPVIECGRGDTNTKAPIVLVDNVHAKYFYSNHIYYNFRTIMSFNRCLYGIVQNCSYEKAAVQHWSPYDNQIYFNSLIYMNLLSAGSTIKDITINYPDVNGEYQYAVDIRYENRYNPEEAQYGQYTKLENIVVNCCESSAPYRDSYNYSNNENTYGEYGYDHHHLIRCYMGHDRDRVVSTEYLLKDLKITAPRGRALLATNSLIDMKTMDIYGTVALNNCMGKIGTINTWYPGYCFNDVGGNLIHINKIECNRFNTSFPYTGQHAILPSYRSNILVTTCNIEMMPNTVNTEDQRNCSYVCTNNNNHIGDGNYFVRNQRSFCRTWSVNRVGSYGGCSLKLSNESGDSDWNFPLLIGGLPFKGVTKNCPTAGSYVAKIYATTYGYNDPSMISDQLKVRLTKADKTIVTSFDGEWKPDTSSTWENIEAGTAYVLEIPFTVDEAQDIEFEFAFSWDMIGGATYLDPHPVVEKQ